MTTTLKFSDGDMVRLGSNQNYSYVSGRNKVKQDIESTLTTDIRASTGLGCSLDHVIGEDTMSELSALSMFPAVFDFHTRIQSGMAALKNAQRSYQFTERTSDELIYEIPPANIIPSKNDFRTFTWQLTALTESGASVKVSGISG